MAEICHLECWHQNAKTRISGKLSNLVSCNCAIQRTRYWIPKIQDGWDPPSWKSTWRHFFSRGWSNLDKISETGAEWHVDCGDVVKIETRCGISIWRTFGRIPWDVIPEPPVHCRVLPPGEFKSWSQSYVSHCRVLPLGEFSVMIPEPYATLQGAVTWQNQCHEQATSQGVIIPSAILKIIFRHIFFCFF